MIALCRYISIIYTYMFFAQSAEDKTEANGLIVPYIISYMRQLLDCSGYHQYFLFMQKENGIYCADLS